jgi:hypothetical protein
VLRHPLAWLPPAVGGCPGPAPATHNIFCSLFFPGRGGGGTVTAGVCCTGRRQGHRVGGGGGQGEGEGKMN